MTEQKVGLPDNRIYIFGARLPCLRDEQTEDSILHDRLHGGNTC